VLDQFEDMRTAAAAEPPRRRRVRRTLGIVVALVVLLVIGAGAGYVALLNHTVTTNVKHSALLPTPGVDGATEAPAKVPALKDAQNILIIGSDARAGLAGARSDVIVLMHVAHDRKSVTLVHFPRDLYVSVPGHGKDKINAAFAYGGSPLLVRTLQDLVGVPIDHVALVDFEGFKNMTDAVGGVDVYAEEASNSRGYAFHQGFNRMNGAAALVFVRERKQLSEGDISRGRRQQAFIKALMLKSLSKDVLANPVKLAQFVDAATSNLTVDNGFTVADLRSEAFAMRNLRGKDIAFVTAPFTGFGTSPSGASIDLVDVDGMKTLGKALRGDAMSTYQDVTHEP
jgi:LCP family protein required for cell wall assembly